MTSDTPAQTVAQDATTTTNNGGGSGSSSAAVVRRVMIVGSGASSSIPKIDCIACKKDCKACTQAYADNRSKNHRLNPSLLIQVSVPHQSERPAQRGRRGSKQDSSHPKKESDGEEEDDEQTTTGGLKNILVDCGKTFRESALKVLAPQGVSALHGVVLTHDHADAYMGLDDLREFSSNHNPKHHKKGMELHTDRKTQETMKQVFPYLFNVTKAQSYVASLDWRLFPEDGAPMQLLDGAFSMLPLPVEHGKNYICWGFAIATPEGTIVYLSDVSAIPEKTMALIKGPLQPLKVLIIDLLSDIHTSVHFNYKEACAAAKAIGAPQTYFTGVSHRLEHNETNKRLLEDFPHGEGQLSYDGLVLYENPPSKPTTTDGLEAASCLPVA